MALQQDNCSDAVACRHQFVRLVGRWSDQFSATYALTQGTENTMDVETHREKGKTRYTKGLIRIHGTADGCQVVWGRANKPPVYILTSCTDELAIWEKVGASSTFQWTRHAEGSHGKGSAVVPVTVAMSCALSDRGADDTLSDAESEYGVSDRQLAAVAMVPETRWEWPMTKAEAAKRVQMIWEQDRLLQNQDLLAELVLQSQEIEDLRQIIRDQDQELEALRRQVANGTREGKGGPQTMEQEFSHPDPLTGASCGLAEKEDAPGDCAQSISEAPQHKEDTTAIPDDAVMEAARCNKRKQAKKERRKRQGKARHVRSECRAASPNETHEEASGSVAGPGPGPGPDRRNNSPDEGPRSCWDATTAGAPIRAAARGADWRPQLWVAQGLPKGRRAWQPKR